ncbi:MAG: endonuclease/exonuclease/phosphatase family protein [Deltaproteobacteria bacterium]|nr:endonuclease/exonuclease/phosphatase family protein [Deltaproteobacteria bacterium]
MRLITLNIWGGHIREPLIEFIKSRKDTDIFCLQEVYHEAPESICTLDDFEVSLKIFSEMHEFLPDHVPFFRPVLANSYGIGMLVHKRLDVVGEGEVGIHHNPNCIGRGPAHSRKLQWLRCRSANQDYAVMNVHGSWNGRGKTDSPERIAQSKSIREFMDTLQMPKVLCGDFNLRPDTQSMEILETGMTNLIKTHQIKSTRTSFYDKEEGFADYVLTSPEIMVKHFEVLQDEVSDHAPLLVDFV